MKAFVKLMPVAVAGLSLVAAPKSASATCTNSYFLCLNDATQESSALARQLEEIECGVRYGACIAHIIRKE